MYFGSYFCQKRTPCCSVNAGQLKESVLRSAEWVGYNLQLIIGTFWGHKQLASECRGRRINKGGVVGGDLPEKMKMSGTFDLKIKCYRQQNQTLMNFPKTSPAELRETPISFNQPPNKAPISRREYRFEPAEPDGSLYHVRVTASFLSPPPQALKEVPESRPLSPLPALQRPPCNPETPKNRAVGLQLRQGNGQKQMGNKLRKNSQSYVGVKWGSVESGSCSSKEQYNPLNAAPVPKRFSDKYRKGSFQLEPTVFFKARKQSSNEEPLATSRTSQLEPAKRKRRGWDETNNFQLSTNYNSQQNSADLTQSQIECSRPNTRKHSQNFYLKKVPSFLTNSKIFRKSFDTAEGQREKTLGIEDFMIAKELGRGAFGRVVLAIDRRSGLVCAIKIMSKREIMQSGMQEQLVRELKIQMFLNHPNVAKVYGFFDDLLHFYILMECALDGHLSDHMARLNGPIREEEAAVLLYQTCSAVAALHTHSIIHRDLKPQNLLMHQGIIKLSDFGWSVNRGAELRTTFCGTPIYLCPQILVGDEYDESVDIWTIGVILYEMLYRNNPFRITCQQELTNILNSPITFDESAVSEGAKEVVRACLSKKAVDRPNIRELMLFEFVMRGHAADEFKRC